MAVSAPRLPAESHRGGIHLQFTSPSPWRRGARSGIRTRTPSRTMDFESIAAAVTPSGPDRLR
jgi:hypothetical protein